MESWYDRLPSESVNKNCNKTARAVGSMEGSVDVIVSIDSELQSLLFLFFFFFLEEAAPAAPAAAPAAAPPFKKESTFFNSVKCIIVSMDSHGRRCSCFSWIRHNCCNKGTNVLLASLYAMLFC